VLEAEMEVCEDFLFFYLSVSSESPFQEKTKLIGILIYYFIELLKIYEVK